MKPQTPEVAEATALKWVQVGIGAGFATCLVYPLVSMAPLPRVLLVVLASTLGPSLALASLGLREVLRLHERSVVGDLGALFNVLAAALLGFNLFTFPTPPAEAGLVDVGPAIGLWYLVGTILMWRSISWVKDTARQRHAQPST